MPRHCGNCNITYNDGRYCRRCGNLLVETNTSQQQEQIARTMKKPSKFPPAILIIHAVAYLAMALILNYSDRHGEWGLLKLYSVPILFGLIIVSFLFLFLSKSNMIYRLTLLFTALSFPWVLGPVLNPVFSPVSDYVYVAQRQREMASYQAERQAHFKYFRKVFKEPQKVVNVNYGYVILENGLCLEPYPSGHAVEIQDYLKTRLIGQYIRVVVIDKPQEYIPGMSSGSTTDFKKGADKQYGDIPAYLYLGDELINVAIAKMLYPNSTEGYYSELKKNARAMDK